MAPKKVLVADDDKFMRMLAAAALKPLGCEILEAADGAAAVAMALEHQPDVVLLDVVMPEANGFDVLAELRRRPETADLSVVMLTTASTPADLTHGAEEGADAYVVKPYDHRELRETVAELLDR